MSQAPSPSTKAQGSPGEPAPSSASSAPPPSSEKEVASDKGTSSAQASHSKRKFSDRSDVSSFDESEKESPTSAKDSFYVDGIVKSPYVSSAEEDDTDEDEVHELMPSSRPVSTQDVLERKPTLEPAFMKMLTVPDAEDELDDGRKLFETNQNVAPDGARGSSFTASRKTGFETWLKSKTSAKQLYGEETEGKVLYAFKDLSLDVKGSQKWVPDPLKLCCQNFARDCLDLGIDDTTAGYSVLKSVSGVMYAGKTTLVLGPPGAGTTTLLRVLSGRANTKESFKVDYISFARQNVNLRDPITRRHCAFVSADDRSHIPVLTVRETMEFAARMTMAEKEGETSEEREANLQELVQRVVESLGLSEQANTIIGGDDLRGVSGGQKRRCTLGEMLFSRDAKLLFLDDITNGLDSSKAQQVMRIIRSACRVLGFSAMVSLLQPNDMLFDAFDDVLVLSSKGEMAFSGPTAEAVPYFESLLERMNESSEKVKDWSRPSGMSSAEYVLMAVSSLEEMIAAKPDLGTLAQKFKTSRDGEKFDHKMQTAMEQLETAKKTADVAHAPLPPYATSSWNQLQTLIHRKLLLIARNPMTIRRILVAIAFGIVIGTLYSSLSQDLMSSLARSGFMFLSLFLVLMLSTAVTVPNNHAMQMVFFKQYGSGFYSAWTFYLANFLCDLPLAIVEALLLSVIPYWWVGMRTSDAGGFFYFFAMLLAMEFVGQAVSRIISSLCPTVVLGQLIASGIIMLCGLVGGFMPHYQGIPPWWQWISWLTPVAYALEGLVLNNYVAGGEGSQSFPVLTIVNENGTVINLGNLTGTEVSSALGQPRIPFAEATEGLNTAGKVMGFNFGMVLIFAFIYDILGLLSLHLSHYLYEPWSRRAIQTTSSKTTLAEIKELFKGMTANFLALKKEEFSEELTAKNVSSEVELSDPNLQQSKKDADVPLLSPSSGAPDKLAMSLAIIDVSYFVPDPNRASKSKNDENTTVPPSSPPEDIEQQQLKSRTTSAISKESKTTSSKNNGWFQDVFRTTDPRNGENRFLSFERIYAAILFRLNLFGGKDAPQPGPPDANKADADVLPPEERIHLAVHRPRSGSKRGRAWSNKLPFGEEEEPIEGGPQAGELQLLNNVTALFRTGEMTALMGPSGCGKTTLLDVMAGYKTAGRTRGDLFLNGNKLTSRELSKYLGYAQQTDLHMPTLSVYESLYFSAACRLPRSYSSAKIRKAVDDVIAVLQLDEFRHVVVGLEDASEGLAKHARKRLTIGVELVAMPRILFLDEPTTDLDSLGAEIVVSAMAHATKKLDIAVVATIHQPSRAVFGRFDRLLFMQKGGLVIYHGPISSFRPFEDPDSPESQQQLVSLGSKPPSSRDWLSVHVIQRQASGLQTISENAVPSIVVADMRPAPTIADTVLAYFAGLGAPPLKQGFNPADHLLLAVDTLEENGVDVADLYDESPEKKQVWEEISIQTKQAHMLPIKEPSASFFRQLSLLLWRNLLSQWRDPKFTVFRFLWYALAAMFIGTTFIRLGCTLQDAVYRIAALFFAVFTAIIPMQVAVIPLVKERAIVYRETASKTYSAWIDGVARLVVDVPFHFIFAIIFYAIYYYAVGLSMIPEKTGYFILMIFFTFWVLTSFGQAVAMLSPNIETANGLAGLVVLLSTFLMGFLIPTKLMPQGWRWAVWINMLYYILQGLCVNELGGEWMQLRLGNATLPCGPMEPFNFTSPSPNAAATVVAGAELPQNGFLRGSNGGLLTNAVLAPPPPSKFGKAVEANLCSSQLGFVSGNMSIVGQTFKDRDCLSSVDNLVECLDGESGLQVDELARSLSLSLGCFPADLQSDMESKLTCLLRAKTPIEKLKCFPELYKLLEFLMRILPVILHILQFFANHPDILSWILYIIFYQTIYVPADVILFVFGWAEVDPDLTGFIADTKWFYCIFAIGMFIVGWEVIKIFSRRFVVWIKR